MLKGKQEDDWIHTTHLMCLIVNVNRTKDQPAIHFNDVYPFAKAVAKEMTKEEKDMLRMIINKDLQTE